MITLKVKKEESNQTIEKYVRKVLKTAPLSFIYKMFRKKDVKINGHWVDLKHIVNENDEISLYITDKQLEEFKNKISLESVNQIKEMIIYEDDNILVLNKPRGLLVTADQSPSKALSQMVLEYLYAKNEYDPKIDLAFTPGPAHRLDRNTSGIVLFGKNVESLQVLFNLLREKKELDKKYLTLVKGEVNNDGKITAPLKKDLKSGLVKVTSIKDGGKNSETIYHVQEKYKNYTLLECTLVTGRTHQIRVHLAYLGYPIVGDRKYGDFNENALFKDKYHYENQFLHAHEIVFKKIPEPLSYLSNKIFVAPLNNEQLQILNNLNKI